MPLPLSLVHLNALPFPLLHLRGSEHSCCDVEPNECWKALFGAVPGEPFSWQEALDEVSFSNWERLWAQHGPQGHAFRCDARVRTVQGDKRCLLVAQPQKGDLQPSYLVLATEIEEIVEKIEADYEQDAVALRMSMQQWHSFFHESATGKAIMGLEGQIMAVNPHLCQIFGYSEAEMLEAKPRDLRHPNDLTRMDFVYENLLQGGPPVHGLEACYLKRDGSSFYTLLSLSLVRDSKGHPLYFAVEMQDDSARREAEIALEVKVRERTLINKELARSNADLERFAFVASHDLQEPLRKIRVFGGRLEKELAKSALSEPSLDYLARMLAAAERMQQLISDLLEFSRPSEPTELKPVDLTRLAHDAASDFEAVLEASGGKIHIEALPTIRGDASRLRQLLCNLISNALKFRGDMPPVVRLSARRVTASDVAHLDFSALQEPNTSGSGQSGDKANHHKADRDGAVDNGTAEAEKSWWEISIADNGIGFDEKDLPRLLEVFGRLHPRNRFTGTGIGLAICRKVVQEHGGDISARSRPGEGATFILALPVGHEPEIVDK